MGSYSTFYVSGKELYSWKHEVNPLLMTLFQDSDRSLKCGTVEDLAKYRLEEDRSNALDRVELLTYETTVNTLKDRLDLMGFTLEFVRNEYNRLHKLRLAASETKQNYGSDNPEFLAYLKKNRRAFKRLTWGNWLRLFPLLCKQNEETGSSASDPTDDTPPDNLLLWYMRAARFDGPYAFLSEDFRCFLRAACESLPPDALAVYDLSELIADEYFDNAQHAILCAEEYWNGEYATTRRTIVLTEGRSDQKAIEGSLNLLRPGLAVYFSFLNFEELAVQGGVSSVLNTLKALISVKVANRIVAILDNDTAAHSAIQAARLTALPQNVRIIFLPNIPLAKKYPTLGPSGMTPMNINGLACSVELFFGSDVLTDSSGQLTPIQWKGYDEKLKRYQGEILHKQDIQNHFSKKLDKAKQDPRLLAAQDWEAMKAIIHSLVTAFHDIPPMDYGLQLAEE